jgi:hypothetical protein
MENNSVFIQCACSEHAVEVNHDEDGIFYLAAWEKKSQRQHSRFYWAWEALCGRYQGVTEIVLSDKARVDLVEALKAE